MPKQAEQSLIFSMSYQVIARKWRPQTFEEVTGQEAITQTLRNAVVYSRLHHAYLFSGARGVGKTTTARLVAKALNCKKTDAPNPTPCSPNDPDSCPSCLEISESRSIDVLEFDAASNTQVDKIRDLIIENINIAPARDRYKVFIIDEVHMLSTSSFNALLKTLEEPPPNVVFIMATTELHKVPDTILSRCQEFQFKTIATSKIFERLKLIAEAEGIKISEAALKEIARAGEGSMRDAQSAFDQVISFSGETIETADVSNALGLAGSEKLTSVIKAISAKDTKSILATVDELIRGGQDLRNFCRDLQTFLRDILIAKLSANEELLDSAILSRAELNKLADGFSESDLIRFFNSLSNTENDLRQATQPRYVLEIGLIKLVEMQKLMPIENILERLVQLENSAPGGSLQSSAAAAASKAEKPTEEKKTLKVDFPLDEVPFPVNTERVTGTASKTISLEPESDLAPVTTKPEFVPPPEIIQNSTVFAIENFPVKLPPISAEDLEHVEDPWLDTAYESKLLREGDNLEAIKDVSRLAEMAIGISSAGGPAMTAAAGIGVTTKTLPSATFNLDPDILAPKAPEDGTDQTLILSENPDETELRRFAENHPAVKRALRIFRGEIVKVEKR